MNDMMCDPLRLLYNVGPKWPAILEQLKWLVI